jgi:hypothetical protein
MLRKVLIILLLSVVFFKSNATSPDSWKLKLVSVELTEGRTSTGYILWNEEWKKQVDSADKKKPHEIIASYYSKHAMPFVVYKNVLRFQQYFGDNVLATNETDTITTKDIIRISKERKGEFDGITGKLNLQVIAAHFVDAINAGPLAVFHVFDKNSNSELYVLSFHPDFDNARIEMIVNGTDNLSLENLAASNNAVVLRFPKE